VLAITAYALAVPTNWFRSAEVTGTIFPPPPPTPPVVTATIDIHPQALNLWSKGTWITAYVELPEGYNVSDIDVSSIMLNGTIPVDMEAPITIGDYDNDTVPDLMVKFNRAAVMSYIISVIGYPDGFTTVTLTITGKLNNGTPFEGSGTIKVIYRMARLGRGIFPI
jgi:hypothetical protein